MTLHPLRKTWAAFALAVLSLAVPAAAARVERNVDRSFDAAAVRHVELENLVGEMTVRGVDGAEIRVHGTVFAEDSAGKSGAQLADALEVEFEQHGERLVVRAIYPTADHRRYHYPRREELDDDLPWFLEWLENFSSTVRYQVREVRVSGSPSGSAATLYADFRLELPAGVAVTAKNAVGGIRAEGVQADQTLDTSSGPIFAKRGSGTLVADTGSGDVVIEQHTGDALADTGSGDVVFRSVRGGKLSADTGSGDVELVDCAGAVDADTGSGDVIASGLVAGASFRADTGSGDVRANGDFTAVRKLVIDTGSGDVILRLSAAPSLRLTVSTGSGDVDVDLPDMHVRRSKGEFVADLGSAEGDGSIDTGSGDVSVRAAN
jgi:hypothetical protein